MANPPENKWKLLKSVGYIAFVLFVLWLWTGTPPLVEIARRPPDNLTAAIEAGEARIVEAHGSGSFGGFGVQGYLAHSFESERRFSTHLNPPLYFENKGQGPDMVATRVFYESGGYRRDGENTLMVLKPNEPKLPVWFVAYSVEMFEGWPRSTDQFLLSVMPEHLGRIAGDLAAFERDRPELDTALPSQLALWVRQGNALHDFPAWDIPIPTPEDMEVMDQVMEFTRNRAVARALDPKNWDKDTASLSEAAARARELVERTREEER